MSETAHLNQETEAGRECDKCPRLVQYRTDCREKFPDWFNAPVPSWGDPTGRLIIVGLAPGLRGANRTGRPFTGDFAGHLLYETLAEAGATSGTFDERIDDGLQLHGVFITNGVRCVPPQNKPVGAEIKNCRSFLEATINAHVSATTYLCLGRVAHETFLSAMEQRRAAFPFGHGAKHVLGNRATMFDSYHCSRYNTNTKRLTTQMFRDVVFAAAEHAQIGRWAL